MMLCETHEAELRVALAGKGLGSLIAEDDFELARRHNRERHEGPSIDTFDPLYDARYNLLENCQRVAYANGESLTMILGCWFCQVQSRYRYASVYSSWVDAAATAMLGKWRRLTA